MQKETSKTEQKPTAEERAAARRRKALQPLLQIRIGRELGKTLGGAVGGSFGKKLGGQCGCKPCTKYSWNIHEIESENLQKIGRKVRFFLPTFNANAISDLTLPTYTKTVKRKI